MAAKYREIRRFRNFSLSQNTLTSALEQCGFRVQHAGETSIRARATLNLWSFGETIDVLIGSFGTDTIVDITSSCVLPTQILDWGKNRKNVRRLFDQIMRCSPAPSWEPVERCGKCDYVLLGASVHRCPECGHDLASERSVITGDKPRSYLRLGLLLALLLTVIESTCWLLMVGDLRAFGLPAFVWIMIVIATAAIINFTAIMFIFGLNHIVQKRGHADADARRTASRA